jgi:hypothetical protein
MSNCINNFQENPISMQQIRCYFNKVFPWKFYLWRITKLHWRDEITRNREIKMSWQTVLAGIKPELYRVSQEECARLWEHVPYVKIYRYNPKHLCPKLNGYGDNGQRKVWSSVRSTHYTYQLRVCPWLCSAIALKRHIFCLRHTAVEAAVLSDSVTYSAWNSKDSDDMVFEFFVVRFNGVTSLTS